MDANLRIKMSQRMPSIRATEKAVLLKMRYLSISDNTVEINNVCYELGVYRNYPNGEIPSKVKRKNARIGVETDFDQFGFEVSIGSSPILPGDISVQNENLLSSTSNCYIQLSIMKYGETTRLERLKYNRRLYEAVKQFNHILFANRPVIQVKVLECRATQVYRIPVGLKISAKKLTVKQSQIASIATMLEGDVNTRVFESENAANWWQHRLVTNAKELITDDSPSVEQSALILRALGNEVTRFFDNRWLAPGQYCELIESWMSVKREIGSELWIEFRLEQDRFKILNMIQNNAEVIRRKRRINMSQRISSIRAVERAVPRKVRYLSITDTTVEINDVRYELGVYRCYPNEDVLYAVEIDFDCFGFEIPDGSDSILSGDISVRTDTDERRHNLPPPFNCYIQLSTMEDGEVTPLQRLAYTRKLYEAVKHFNHVLFANRPVIQVNELVCLDNHVYRIPVGLKISANKLSVGQSKIASVSRILEGDVNTLEVSRLENAENWWQHYLVQNANELFIHDSLSAEQSGLMLRSLGNKIIRFHNQTYLTIENDCELIESWMSVKRKTGAELCIELRYKKNSNDVLEMIQTRMEVIRKDERCVTIRGENGTHIEVCEDDTMHHRWAVKVKIVEN
ncbi:hypothetical protein B9Z55_007774 [Caenorhabditis nigoni]|nr:hypothetical protein B9Z55_007774 [Caenorhabditis nigoni]